MLFTEEENYLFFLQKFKTHLSHHCSVIAYCLMPTHFHFLILIRIKTDDALQISKSIAALLRSYTRAINKRYDRTGNLFQQNTKAKEITDEEYLLTIINYIHQNPLRTKLVSRLDEWNYSNFKDHALLLHHGMRNQNIYLDLDFMKQYFKTSEEFVRYSNEMIETVRKEFWVGKVVMP